MVTDLRLSGRAATMGRGVISDVSQALISDFADNLAAVAGSGGPGGVRAAPRGLSVRVPPRGPIRRRR